MVKIEVKNRHITAILLFFAVGLVIAYGGTDPTLVGHSAGELHIEVQTNLGPPETITLQEAINEDYLANKGLFPIEFIVGDPDTTAPSQKDCSSILVNELSMGSYCADEDGCTLKVFMQHETQGNDQVRTRTFEIYMEEELSNENNPDSIYGNTVGINNEWLWQVGPAAPQQYVIADTLDGTVTWFNVSNAAAPYCGGTNPPTPHTNENLLFLEVYRAVTARVIIYD